MFKNALTGLHGRWEGGSDFNPKGKSETEIRRFCVVLMTELYRYLHPSTDVPAVTGRRSGNRLHVVNIKTSNRHGEAFHRKVPELWRQSAAPGSNRLRSRVHGINWPSKRLGKSLKGMRCAVSGSGNVAQYTVQKLLELEAKSDYRQRPEGCTRSLKTV
jgi:glutamate dehydrogenase (NADP+)